MKEITAFRNQKHDIDLGTAKGYIKNFRARYAPDNKEGFPYSEAFNKDAIQKLLNHQDCAGLRIFNGLKIEGDSQEVVFILMGIDSYGKNIHTTHASLNLQAKALDGSEEDDSPEGDSPAQEDGQKNPPYDDGEN